MLNGAVRNDRGITFGREGRNYHSVGMFRVVLSNSEPMITCKGIRTLCYSKKINVRNYTFMKRIMFYILY